jgi:peptidoglycan/LPS O-acetylase OafA/YrhL
MSQVTMPDHLRDARIDLIKAVCIILVLIWHLQPITPVMLPTEGSVAFWSRQALKFFNMNITLLAVPTFILVSLYLFIGKASTDENYWKKRLLRLIQIFVFWVCIQFILYLLLGGKLPLPLKSIVPGGGPDLPFGPSIFYYLFILILCTVYTYLFLKLSARIKIFLSVTIIILSCLHFFLSPLYGIGIDTRSMDNYYVYIPVAYYFSKYKDQFIQYRLWFLIAFFLSLIAEWNFTGMTSAYGRLSIFFGVLSFVAMFVPGPMISNRTVQFLAGYSLGIFALHIYAYNLCKSLYAVLKNQIGMCLWISVESMMIFTASVALTCLVAYLLGKTKWRIYVS